MIFVEIIMLAIVIGLEVYKQFKCPKIVETPVSNNNVNTVKTETYQSNADELKKYKELLDSGIITQEEFDAKKNKF